MLKDKIKGYDVYSGLDVNDESIIALIHQVVAVHTALPGRGLDSIR